MKQYTHADPEDIDPGFPSVEYFVIAKKRFYYQASRLGSFASVCSSLICAISFS